MTYIEYFVVAFAYELLVLLCSTPFLLLLHLTESFTEGSVGYLRAALKIGLLFWVLGGSWIAHGAVRRNVFKGEGFVEAIGNVFAAVRLLISFVPVVGTLFPVRSRRSSLFDRPDDPSSL